MVQSSSRLSSPPPPASLHAARHRQAPALPELLLTAGGAEALNGFFEGPPVGVCNEGVLSEGDLTHYKEAMLKPGALRGNGHAYAGTSGASAATLC